MSLVMLVDYTGTATVHITAQNLLNVPDSLEKETAGKEISCSSKSFGNERTEKHLLM